MEPLALVLLVSVCGSGCQPRLGPQGRGWDTGCTIVQALRIAASLIGPCSTAWRSSTMSGSGAASGGACGVNVRAAGVGTKKIGRASLPPDSHTPDSHTAHADGRPMRGWRRHGTVRSRSISTRCVALRRTSICLATYDSRPDQHTCLWGSRPQVPSQSVGQTDDHESSDRSPRLEESTWTSTAGRPPTDRRSHSAFFASLALPTHQE